MIGKFVDNVKTGNNSKKYLQKTGDEPYFLQYFLQMQKQLLKLTMYQKQPPIKNPLVIPS